YIIRVINNSGSSVTVNLGVSVGLDYNDLSLPDNGHLFEEITYKGEVGTVVLSNISKDNTYDDGVDTFTTGQYPNNYIWYSGKLWRAVSVNNEEKTTKLVTQWNISSISYNASDRPAFADSHMEEWLNDTSVDGFLGNLREPDKFIVMNSKWNATMDATSLGSIIRPRDDGTIVTDAVGLLNMYEYQSSYHGTTYSNGYLNNGLYWWTLTPYSLIDGRSITYKGTVDDNWPSTDSRGVRPVINLKSDIEIADGNGTIDNPYRLKGDNDKNLSETNLKDRYSGEYLRFGIGENNLYRIVSHENGNGTKIVSAEPLKDSGKFIESEFGSNTTFSSANTIGVFLNGEYLTNYVGNEYINMIEDSTSWYLGMVGEVVSYKLAKYVNIESSSVSTNTKAKVGLLRYGELLSGQFNRYEKNYGYWLLTPFSVSNVRNVINYSSVNIDSPSGTYFGLKPSFNLKSNIIITGGLGTKEQPFEIALQ
ncbi:MAG TPA: hypothetical protein IAB38_01665, partial [Candidatus Onthousia excrementipullorum]|nr:hypothetical protein [Candidatus Onthousia excrementipullorum]